VPSGDLEPGTIQRNGSPEALDHTLDPHGGRNGSKPVNLSTILAAERDELEAPGCQSVEGIERH
jgi:hypothetical protein